MVLLLALIACRNDPHEGTIIGNPGDTQLTAADPKDMRFTYGALPVDTMTLMGCSGAVGDVVEVGALFVLGEDLITIPEGSWCGLALGLDGPLELTAEADPEHVELSLEVGEVTLTGDSFTVDGAYVLELAYPEWLSRETLVLNGQDVVIDSSHFLHGTLASMVGLGSALFADDGDGVIDDAERADGALSEGERRGGNRG